MHYIGLMSGTSLDAADAVLVAFVPGRAPHIKATASLSPPDKLRKELLQLAQNDGCTSLKRLGTIHEQLGSWFADAASEVMNEAGMGPREIVAIGSHGQTVRHEPDIDPSFSMQLGSASRIAARTGCTVVADFRNADMAIGGQGAPLVPAFHRDLFAHTDTGRIAVNIGGIANLTILPAGSNRGESHIVGFDTGPGNALMDGWTQSHLGTKMDTSGRWAASGHVNSSLLAQMLQDPYLHRIPPKSTGREYFNESWLQAQLGTLSSDPLPEDIQATLCEFTAQSIAKAINGCGPGYDEIIVCGGGAHNAHLMQRLAALLSPRTVTTSAQYGIGVDWVEAAAFAWLAMRRIEGLPGNLPSVTGARSAAILGAIHAPPIYN